MPSANVPSTDSATRTNGDESPARTDETCSREFNHPLLRTVSVPAADGASGSERVRISYSVAGSGPVLVLLIPGMLVPREMFARMSEDLAASGRHTAIALDNRGMGSSGCAPSGWNAHTLASDAWAVVDDARTSLERVTARRVALVGHSMGGMVAQRMAVLRPGEAGMLGLLSTHAGGLWNLIPTRAVVGAALKLAWHRFAPRVRAGVTMGLHFTDGYLDGEAARREEILRRYLAGAGDDFGADGEGGSDAGEVAKGHLSVVTKHSLQNREAGKLAACKRIYKMVLAGRADCVIVPSASRKLASAIGAHLVVEVEGAHFIVEEAYEAVFSNLMLGLNSAYGQSEGDGETEKACTCAICMPGKRTSTIENFRMC